MTEKELAVMRGYRPSLRKDSGAIPFDKMAISITKVPAYVDWRLYGNLLFSFTMKYREIECMYM